MATTRSGTADTAEHLAEWWLQGADRLARVTRTVTGMSIDAWERAWLTVADVEELAGALTGSERLRSIAATQAGITRDVAHAYAAAARGLTR